MARCVGRQRAGGGRRRRLARLLAAAALAVAAAGTGACGQAPEVEWPADPTGPPTPTVEPAEAETIAEVLAVFDEFRQVEVALQADPVPADEAKEQLTGYLADPLLTLTLFDVATMYRRDVVREGRPTWEATVSELRLDATPPTATVRDCLDATGWELADRADGSPAPVDGLPARFAPGWYVMEFNAKSFDGRWLFDQIRVEGDERC